MTVVMVRQMSLENQVEKSDKKNDQDQVDGMRQEVYSKTQLNSTGHVTLMAKRDQKREKKQQLINITYL